MNFFPEVFQPDRLKGRQTGLTHRCFDSWSLGSFCSWLSCSCERIAITRFSSASSGHRWKPACFAGCIFILPGRRFRGQRSARNLWSAGRLQIRAAKWVPPGGHVYAGPLTSFSTAAVRLLISCGVTDQEAFCPQAEDGRLLQAAPDGHGVWFAATSGTNIGNEVTLGCRSVSDFQGQPFGYTHTHTHTVAWWPE